MPGIGIFYEKELLHGLLPGALCAFLWNPEPGAKKLKVKERLSKMYYVCDSFEL